MGYNPAASLEAPSNNSSNNISLFENNSLSDAEKELLAKRISELYEKAFKSSGPDMVSSSIKLYELIKRHRTKGPSKG